MQFSSGWRRRAGFRRVWGIGVLLGCLAATASAQPQQPVPYFDTRVGLNHYGGERRGLQDGVSRAFGAAGGAGFGLEGGFDFSARWSAGAFAFFSRYPGLLYADAPRRAGEVIVPSRSSDWIHTLGVVGRMRFPAWKKVTPYAQAGGSLSFSLLNGNVYVGAGPRLGVGGDVGLSETVSLFAELDAVFVLPGDAMDLAGPSRGSDSFWFAGAGLRYRFRRAARAARTAPYLLRDVYGAARLEVGEEGLYAADVRLDGAARDVAFAWDFGDGTHAAQMVATHRYERPGTYTLTFTLTRGARREQRTLTTVVAEAMRPVEEVSLRHAPLVPRVGEPVTFSPVTSGSGPLACTWDFGDGVRADTCEAAHRYMQPGAYTVQLEVRNAGGAARHGVGVTVRENPCADLVRLHPVYFAPNESELDVDARGFLRENIARLAACPSVRVELRGYAEPGERAGDRLARARATSVAQYYANLGIPAGRIVMASEGRVASVPRGEAQWQYRSVESIPRQD